MKTNQPQKKISDIAKELLLYFYGVSYVDSDKLKRLMLSNKNKGISLDNLCSINKFRIYNDNQINLALIFLKDRELVNYKSIADNVDAKSFFKITEEGIIIVEGVGNEMKEGNNFPSVFNITLNINVTLESLLKVEFGALFESIFKLI